MKEIEGEHEEEEEIETKVLLGIQGTMRYCRSSISYVYV